MFLLTNSEQTEFVAFKQYSVPLSKQFFCLNEMESKKYISLDPRIYFHGWRWRERLLVSGTGSGSEAASSTESVVNFFHLLPAIRKKTLPSFVRTLLPSLGSISDVKCPDYVRKI